jgi:hypothetical protein
MMGLVSRAIQNRWSMFFLMRLKPSTSKGGCEFNNGLRIFSKMLDLKNVRHLTHFELNEISVHEVN